MLSPSLTFPLFATSLHSLCIPMYIYKKRRLFFFFLDDFPFWGKKKRFSEPSYKEKGTTCWYSLLLSIRSWLFLLCGLRYLYTLPSRDLCSLYSCLFTLFFFVFFFFLSSTLRWRWLLTIRGVAFSQPKRKILFKMLHSLFFFWRAERRVNFSRWLSIELVFAKKEELPSWITLLLYYQGSIMSCAV